MATVIRIINEPKRGCGFRKQGGLYLIAGIPEAECGKLPLKLEVCPCCGQGIKPARAWTWVDAEQLFSAVQCRLADAQGDCSCPLSAYNLVNHPRMGLLWIGGAHYKMPADFLAEGMAQGLSRRITAIPRDFVLGETYVLLAHRKAITRYCAHPTIERRGNILTEEQVASCPDCNGTGYINLPGIFGCFRPTRIEYIVHDNDTEERLDRLEKRGITLVRLLRTDNQAEMFPVSEERVDVEYEIFDDDLDLAQQEELDMRRLVTDQPE